MSTGSATDDGRPAEAGAAVGSPGEVRVVDVTRTCDVLALEPFTVANGDRAAGTWSCTRCGSAHPASTSISVRLQRRSDRTQLSMVVCPACARQMR